MRANELVEAFDNPLQINWQSQSDKHWYGEFTVEALDYSIVFTKDPDYLFEGKPVSVWDLSFTLTENGFSGTSVIGTSSNHMKIFATVIQAIRVFLKAQNPEFIMINAYKENQNRFKLYDRLAKVFAKELAGQGYQRIPKPAHKHHEELVSKYYDSIAFKR